MEINQIAPPSVDALPDDVVLHILSFLPTKFSVATSTLSKRWRYLWAHVPSLDLRGRYGYPDTKFGVHSKSFFDVVDSVMSLYKVEHMNDFLLYNMDADEFTKIQAESCITSAIARNVKKIDILSDGRAVLPRCMFTCKTLVDLRLTFCGVIPMSGDVYLPALKCLCLHSVRYESDQSIVHLLSGCPVLEELSIHYPRVVPFCITSTTIKRLVLKSHYYKCMGKIDAPALRYLQLEGCVPEDVSARTLASIIQFEAVYDRYLRQFEYDQPDSEIGAISYCRSMLEFAGRFHNLNCLKLLSRGLSMMLELAFPGWGIKFENLAEFELDDNWCPLTYILENDDSREVFIIRESLEVLIIYETYNDGRFTNPGNQWLECLYTVRTIKFEGFISCEEQHFKILRYLMRNAIVLKRIEIYFHAGRVCSKAKSDAVKRISSFELRSKECELFFH